MRKAVRITLYTLGGLLGLVVLAILAVFAVLRTEAGRDWVVVTVTEAVSRPGEMELRLAGLDGPLPGSIGIRGLEIADADGVWLSVGSARLVWHPLALFAGRVEIDAVEADGVHVRRLPPSAPAPEEAPPADFTIPSIPVDIVVRRLSVENVRLDELVAGVPIALRAEGRIAGSEGGTLKSDLTVERIDGEAGRLVLTAAMDPNGRTVDIDAEISEPQGGLIARTLAVPGLPPVNVRLTGAGPVDAVAGKLTASMGDAIGVDLDYRGAFLAETLELALNGRARIEPLLPEDIRPAAAGGLAIDLSTRLESQTLTLERLSVASDALSLSAEGTAVLDARTLDMRVEAALDRPELISVFAPTVAATGLAVRLRADGTFDQPRLHVEADADRVTLPAATVDGLALTFRADPQRPLAEGVASTFDLALLATRVTASQAPEAAGPMFLGLSGAADMPAQRVTVERLTLSHPLARAEGSADVVLEPLGLQAKLSLDAPSLAPLSAFAGMPVAGAAQVNVDATVADGGNSIQANVDGTVTNLQLPTIPAAAALAGETARLHAAVETAADGSHAVDANLETAAATVKVDGTIAAAFETLDIGYAVAMPRLAAFAPLAGTDIAGAADLSGKVTGAVASPTVTALLEGRQVAVSGQQLGAVRGEVRAADVATAATGELSLRAAPPQGAVQIATAFAKTDTALRLTGVRIGAPGGGLNGEMAVPLDGSPAQGRLAGRFDDLAPLLAIAGMDGGGALRLSVDLSGREGAQAAVADVSISRFRLAGAGAGEPLALASAELKADAVLAPTPRGTLSLTASGLTSGANKVDRLTLRVEGAQSGADFTLATAGEATVPFRIEAGGNAGYADGAATVRLDRLTGTLRDERLNLRRPARIVAAPGRIELADLDLALSTGSIRADATLRPDRVQADLRIDNLPLALARLASPDMSIEGEVSGRVGLAGTAAAPSGDARFDFSGVRYGGASELPPVAARIEADWRGGTLSSTARISGFDGPPIALDARIPLRMDPQTTTPFVPPDGPLSASVRWNGEIAPLFLLLPLDGHMLSGRADIDMGVTGSVSAPRVAGTVQFENGRYENLLTGTLLDRLSLRAEAAGDRITIREMSATDGARGTIAASGYALADGSQVDVQARVRDSVVVRRDDVTAEIDADLAFRRSPESAEATGKITTEMVEIRLVDNLPPGVVDLEVIERGGGRPPPEPDLQPETPSVDAPDLRLDIEVAMPSRVFVRGRGLDSEWAGSFKIAGTASRPDIRGEIHSVRGNLDLLTHSFEVRPSTIDVSQDTRNAIVAALDITAAAELDELEAIVRVTGTAAAPEIAITSNPPRPQDEVLALILFGETTAQLSAFEAVQLAAAVAQLTRGGGGGVLDFARNALGVDVLRVGDTESGAPTVQAGKYIAKDVFVGVEQGAAAGTSAVSVEAEIFPNVSVQSKVKPDGESTVGVKMEWDY